MDNAFKGAVDFLLFSYFGITSDDDKDTIIRAAIDVAYKDATGQGAFNTLFRKNDPNTELNKEKIGNAKKYATKILTDFITQNVMGKELGEKWHVEICEKVQKVFAGKKIVPSQDVLASRGGQAFSYGNTQKWVNMTLKNLYIIDTLLCEIGYHHKEDDGWTKFRENVSEFHIPIDNYILQSVYQSKNAHKTENGTYTITQESKNETYKIQMEGTKYSWSQIPTYEFYQDIQHIIHELYDKSESPLVWENETWLKIAKARKKSK